MLSILIIDDEPLARQHLRQLLADFSDIRIVGEAGSASEGRQLIEQETPDAILLDIEMPRDDGFALLRSLNHSPKVIFVTAHASHALEAFDFQAVDYLLKPVIPERLAMALERLRSKIPSETAWGEKDRICFKTPQRTLIADSGQVIALEADGDFSRIYIDQDHPLLICHTLSYYEKILPAPPFLRLDRSLIINRDRIKKIEPLARDHVLTFTGCEKSFILGRAAHRRLAEILKEED